LQLAFSVNGKDGKVIIIMIGNWNNIAIKKLFNLCLDGKCYYRKLKLKINTALDSSLLGCDGMSFGD
jgi:hypothetical protein